MNIIVIYHKADFDGLFCREIARKFLGTTAEYIGWDYGDTKIPFPAEGAVYVLDLSPECFERPQVEPYEAQRLIWIDHHKSAIDRFNPEIPGYRIDGVAACRLAWQWFYLQGAPATIWPDKAGYVERRVREPLAVRLAGEYDIWDKRDENAEVFQFGLRSIELDNEHWDELLNPHSDGMLVERFLEAGRLLQRYQRECDKTSMGRSFLTEFEGLKFLVLNQARFNSLTFASRDVPETAHDALLGFVWTGSEYAVSLYHALHRKELDLSAIAKRYGGGGHRGACGFRAKWLPFVSDATEMRLG